MLLAGPVANVVPAAQLTGETSDSPTPEDVGLGLPAEGQHASQCTGRSQGTLSQAAQKRTPGNVGRQHSGAIHCAAGISEPVQHVLARSTVGLAIITRQADDGKSPPGRGGSRFSRTCAAGPGLLRLSAGDKSEASPNDYLRPVRQMRTDTLFVNVLAEELTHQPCDLVAVRFWGEMAGVEQVEIQRLQVALVWLGPRPRERWYLSRRC
jgi:hypothetical protein